MSAHGVQGKEAIMHCTLILAALLISQVGGGSDEQPAADSQVTTQTDKASEKTEEERPPNLHPGPPPLVPAAELNAAIQRGIDFLVKDQNDDGSWGSAERTKDLNIIAGIGSHHAFRTAVTAMCVSALIEVGDDRPDVQKALEGGERFLLEDLPKVRRDDPMLLYNVWTHAYGIQALVDMHGRVPGDADRRKEIERQIREQFEKLGKYESAEGGWGYYDFTAGTQRPASSSTSFVNATVLVAFHDAQRIGIEPPKKLLDRGLLMLQRQKKPDNTYLYGTYLRNSPLMPINRPGGSLGRSQACNLALRLWGDKTIDDKVCCEWLDRLISRNGWLDMGRKRPVPHESHFQVAGYFYYYGHYYATLTIPLLAADKRTFYQGHLATILLKHQEKDGSWWDYPLYNYHQQYGTAFAIMSLQNCLRR
jgi:hypothetical protein